jgi:hypothetical protein
MNEDLTKEEIMDMMSGFVAKAFSMDEVINYAIVARDKTGAIKLLSRGETLETCGLIDFAKSRIYSDMMRRAEEKEG